MTLHTKTEDILTEVKSRPRIIKADEFEKLQGKISSASSSLLEAEEIKANAEEVAKQIIQKANDEAQELLSSTQDKVIQMMDNARVKASEIIPKIQSQERDKAAKKATNEILVNVSKFYDDLDDYKNHISNLVELSLRKIIGQLEKKELILSTVYAGIEELKEQRSLTLYVSPSEHQEAQEAVEEINANFKHTVIQYIELASDLKPEEYRILSKGGVLEIKINDQISNIIQAIRSVDSIDI